MIRHFIAGAVIYTLAHLVAAPVDSLLAVATVAVLLVKFSLVGRKGFL